jgi:hypothetical protein
VVIFGRIGEDEGDVSFEVGLVAFGQHHVVAAPLDNRLSERTLGQEGIHREDAAFEHQVSKQGDDVGDLVGLVIDPPQAD